MDNSIEYEIKTYTKSEMLDWLKSEFSGEFETCKRCGQLNRVGYVCSNCKLS